MADDDFDGYMQQARALYLEAEQEFADSLQHDPALMDRVWGTFQQALRKHAPSPLMEGNFLLMAAADDAIGAFEIIDEARTAKLIFSPEHGNEGSYLVQLIPLAGHLAAFSAQEGNMLVLLVDGQEVYRGVLELEDGVHYADITLDRAAAFPPARCGFRIEPAG